jgi:LysM repeat protein
MNNQSPLVPQNTFLEQKNKGRTRVKIAVFVVLAIHGVGLMVLLMQGCQKPPEAPPPTPEPTNATPAFVEPTNAVPAATNATVSAATPATATVAPTPVETPTPPAPPTTGTEYTVAKGDTFGSIHKKLHVSVKAITEANPGVDSTKLKIGQKLHIPAAAAPAATSATGAAPTEALSAGGEPTYAVKSGDNLSSIAKEKGTTVKALRAANNLKTDRITVGQKLKIPAKTAAPAGGSTAAPEPASGTSTATPPVAPPAR